MDRVRGEDDEVEGEEEGGMFFFVLGGWSGLVEGGGGVEGRVSVGQAERWVLGFDTGGFDGGGGKTKRACGSVLF